MKVENVFRPTYRKLSTYEQSQVDSLKATGQALWDLMALAEIDNGTIPGASRHLSLARTRLEESIMWAVKGMTG